MAAKREVSGPYEPPIMYALANRIYKGATGLNSDDQLTHK